MPTLVELTKELQAFERHYVRGREDAANHSRGEFLEAFPLGHLKNLTVDQYVIGTGGPTFCTHVEAKTKDWAHIQGSTAFKFGIYFGSVKSQPTPEYRFTAKFGETPKQAFAAVKTALLALVKAGQAMDFAAIDENPLSQMFKAKILSLYFPDRYLNVCSKDHIVGLASQLGIPSCPHVSEYQHRLVQEKNGHPVTRHWGNVRFMEFLFARFNPKEAATPGPASPAITKPAGGKPPRVDFAGLQEAWDAIGKKSEAYALAWERKRLAGMGHPELIEQIDDRRDRPGYGYDFLSHSAPGRKRYIEVKSVGREAGAHRFFLSENEHAVSESEQCGEDYFFYLVFYGGDGNPENLFAVPALKLYETAEIEPCAYRVRFNWHRGGK